MIDLPEIKIGEVDISAILENIINFVLGILKIEVPEIEGIL